MIQGGRTALRIANGTSAPLEDVPVLPVAEFHDWIEGATTSGARVSALYGAKAGGREGLRLTAVLAVPSLALLEVASAHVAGRSYPSITPRVPQAHLFEREVHEQFGVEPEGHPWLKPVRFPQAGGAPRPAVGQMQFFQVEGEEVHEVAVGPVHAGVIEPGHFRFQAHGETVIHLEISLGYQHRGVERALEAGPDARTVLLTETIAGDASIAHSTAHAGAMEALQGAPAPPRAQALRAVALELERVANHVGDLGALAGDIAFLPTASWCGRLRGDVLNLTLALTGSRMGRAFVVPGGVAADAGPELAEFLGEGLARAVAEARQATDLLWRTGAVRDRFERCGTLSRSACEELGVVGPPARACGLPRDIRRKFPAGAYASTPIEARMWPTGDVEARARVRWMEVEQSAAYVDRLLSRLPSGAVARPPSALAPSSIAVSLVESWRGEVCHVVETDRAGKFSRYKVVDASFHNWPALAVAMRGQAISDFPLVNKSFNLSYCGHDL